MARVRSPWSPIVILDLESSFERNEREGKKRVRASESSLSTRVI